MKRAGIGFLGLLVCGPLGAQVPADRWSFQVHGETLADRGELRLIGDSGRLLLQSADRFWRPITIDTLTGQRIVFRYGPALRLTGVVGADHMNGRVFEHGDLVATWQADLIQRGADRWPVRPRVTVRQVITGRGDTLASFPAPLLASIPEAGQLAREHAALARQVGLPSADPAGVAARSRDMMLGLDSAGRAVARRMLQQIAATPAADDRFRALFIDRDGNWRLGLHDAAWQFAVAGSGRPINTDSLLALLTNVGVRTDSASLRQSLWQLWGRQRDHEMRDAFRAVLASQPSAVSRDLLALMSGYDSAVQWWVQAVQWLMESNWIAEGSGWTSPSALVARFWDQPELTLPALQPRHFGTVQAAPVIPAGALTPVLLRADNAIAAEWLADPARRLELLAAWRRLALRDPTPLGVMIDGRSIPVTTAADVVASRLGGFLADSAAIRIEPAILPVFAIGTVVHEWQHILFEAARSSGTTPLAWRDADWGVTLVEADPWLGEGAAEWATEALFEAVRGSVPLFTLAEMEKRQAIAAINQDDPHVLGYLLVRGAAEQVRDPARVREALIRGMHDPMVFAAAVRLAGPVGRGLARPSTWMLIPEVTFEFDGGIADHPRRRILFPASAGVQ